MNRYFIHLSYNGTPFFGWQIQPGMPTVQGTLERCLSLKMGRPVAITGCGRTDTGVHARNYYAHFDCENPIADPKDLVFRLNAFLPNEIVIHHIWQVAPKTHARFDALSRTYHYYITQQKNPFHQNDAYYLYGSLDFETMQQACDMLLDNTDFTSFSKLHTQVKTNNCKLMEARWFYIQPTDNEFLLVFRIKADRFLRNMVRAIVGTLLEVGKGKMSLEEFRETVEKRDRCAAGDSVPAHALFLEEVTYPFTLPMTT